MRLQQVIRIDVLTGAPREAVSYTSLLLSIFVIFSPNLSCLTRNDNMTVEEDTSKALAVYGGLKHPWRQPVNWLKLKGLVC